MPIIARRVRTFGMEGMFRRLGIYSSIGQLYDRGLDQVATTAREKKDGQILQEGANEAGMASFIAAGSSTPTTACT
ncbi:MAG: hypothetical protein R3E53_12790 [Myxococcota bacterium]